MKPGLSAGLTHSETIAVDERVVVPALAPVLPGLESMPPVLATAWMVGFVEWSCIRAIGPFLEPGEQSVGTHVDLSHVAATPLGFTVTSEVRLASVERRKLRFEVTCRDDADVICKGFHNRFVIDRARFLAQIELKAGRRP